MNDARSIEISDTMAVMSTRGGRAMISRILDRSGVFRDTFDIDPHVHAQNAGRRQLGLWLLNEIKDAAPG